MIYLEFHVTIFDFFFTKSLKFEQLFMSKNNNSVRFETTMLW